MSILTDLEALGFVNQMPSRAGDFRLLDDSDGLGVYIAEWSSAEACPLPDALRARADVSVDG